MNSAKVVLATPTAYRIYEHQVRGSPQCGISTRLKSASGLGCAKTRPAAGLGPVDIHRSQIMAPTKNSMAANEIAVFS